MFEILELNKIKALGMQNLQLCQFVKFLISKSLWKLGYIEDILIKLHDAMSELGVGLESGLGLEILTATEKNYHL